MGRMFWIFVETTFDILVMFVCMFPFLKTITKSDFYIKIETIF